MLPSRCDKRVYSCQMPFEKEHAECGQGQIYTMCARDADDSLALNTIITQCVAGQQHDREGTPLAIEASDNAWVVVPIRAVVSDADISTVGRKHRLHVQT